MAAYKHNVQYVNYYTDGSAARKLELTVPQRKTAVLPKPRKVKRVKIYVDPVAIVGVVVAVCMLIVLAVGIVQLQDARSDMHLMERYVSQLTRENEQLAMDYANSYDLGDVERMAQTLGMIPSAQAQHTQIHITLPAVAEEPTLWENIGTFLAGLFA